MAEHPDTASRAQSGPDNPKTQLQACRRCNEKKTRCDKKWPICSVCAKRNQECVYTGAPRRRGPGKSKQHVQQLEERLRRMEALIQQQPQVATTLSTQAYMAPASHDGSAPSTSFENGYTGMKPQNVTQNHPDDDLMVDPLLSNDYNVEARRSQDPTPPLERIRERVKNSMQMPGFMAKAFARLYSNNEISWFVAPLLDEINTQFPMFDVGTLVQRIERTAPGEQHSPAWTTIIESIMARVVLVRAATDGVEYCYELAWDLIGSGLKRLPILLTSGSGGDSADVLDALLSMALFMKGTADQRTASMLVSTAIRTYWTHLHHFQHISSDQEASTTRKLWILYTLDRELSLCHGITPSIRESEIGPSDPTTQDQSITSHSRLKGLVHARVRLARVQEAIHARLYSPKATANPMTCAATISAASDLHNLLQAAQLDVAQFVTSIASHSHPHPDTDRNNSHGLSFAGLQTTLPSQDTNLVYLHFAFYNCISMIYTAVLKATYPCAMAVSSTHVDGEGYLADAAAVTQAKVFLMTAARSTLIALRSLPVGTLGELWHYLPYPLAAALTLLQPLLDQSRPGGTKEAISDANLISQFSNYIREAATNKGFPLDRLIAGMAEMARLAQLAAHGGSWDYDDAAHMEAVRDTITKATHPMYLAQSLLNNLPTRDCDLGRDLVRLMTDREYIVPLPEGQPPFAPDILCLDTMVKFI